MTDEECCSHLERDSRQIYRMYTENYKVSEWRRNEHGVTGRYIKWQGKTSEPLPPMMCWSVRGLLTMSLSGRQRQQRLARRRSEAMISQSDLSVSPLSAAAARVVESISWRRVHVLQRGHSGRNTAIHAGVYHARRIWNLVGHSWHAQIPVMIVSDLLARLMPGLYTVLRLRAAIRPAETASECNHCRQSFSNAVSHITSYGCTKYIASITYS